MFDFFVFWRHQKQRQTNKTTTTLFLHELLWVDIYLLISFFKITRRRCHIHFGRWSMIHNRGELFSIGMQPLWQRTDRLTGPLTVCVQLLHSSVSWWSYFWWNHPFQRRFCLFSLFSLFSLFIPHNAPNTNIDFFFCVPKSVNIQV